MINIIKDSASNLVLCATAGKLTQEDGVYLDAGVKTGIPTDTTTVDQVESLPQYFCNMVWAYDGAWTIYDQVGYDLYVGNIKNDLIKQIDATRKELLAASDWTQLPDVQLSNKTAWASYRQELRDIPEQPDYPFNVVYPIPPVKPGVSQPVVSGMQEV